MNEQYMHTLIQACQQLLTVNMINDDDRQARLPIFNSFIRQIIESLLGMFNKVDKRLKDRLTELAEQVFEQVVYDSSEIEDRTLELQQEHQKQWMMRREQTIRNVRDAGDDEVEHNSVHSIFVRLIDSYKNSQQFKVDVDYELNLLIELVFESELANSEDSKEDKLDSNQLDSESFSRCIISYLKQFED